MNWPSARSSRAAGPHSTLKRALAILTARSGSRIPSAWATSSCVLGANGKARGVPQRRTSTLSSSFRPCGTEGWGGFGSWTRSASIRSSISFTSSSRTLMRSPTSRICVRSAAASSPRLRAWPMASEARLRRALRSSASLMRRRRVASWARIPWMGSAPPWPASARSTASGCSRTCRSSSTGLGGVDGRGALRLDAGNRADAIVRLEVDDAHAPGVAALRGDVRRVEADHLALGRDDQDVVAVVHLQHGDHVAVTATRLDVDDPLAGPTLQAVLVERRPLAEPALGDGQDRHAFLHHVGGDDLVTLVELDALHAARAPAGRAHFLLREADDHPELGGDHHLAPAIGAPRGHDAVVVVQADGLDSTRPRMGIRVELGLLDRALLGGEQDVAARREVAHRHARRHPPTIAEA